MTLLSEIEKLPDGASQEQIAPYFERAVTCKSRDLAFRTLVELADRQWHTYSKLKSEISIKIEQWLISNWNRDSLSDIENMITIVGCLGLQNVYTIMREEFPKLSSECQHELQLFFEEAGESVADPFISFR